MLKKLSSLHHIFYPKTIGVIGASRNPMKVGHHILASLINGGYNGKIYPVNPAYDEILGLKAFPSVKLIPDEVDLAIIAIPASSIPQIMEELGEKGVKGAIIIAAGFKEAGEFGEKLQREVANLANKYGISVIGPNTFGIVNLHANLNASFTPYFSKLKKGGISLVSQSGGVCHVLASYAMKYRIGFSKILSLGNRLNIEFSDMLEYLLADEDTKSIALYIEGIDDPRSLMDAAKKVIPFKPIVAYKAGRFSKRDIAAFSHTGSLAGDYLLYKAAFKQVGIILANNCLELISIAKALAFQRPAKGDKVAVISLTAGLSIIMADICEECGLKLANFSPETKRKLEKIIPPLTIRSNPVDIGLLASDEERSGEAIYTIVEDNNTDIVIINYNYSWHGSFLRFPIRDIIEAHRIYEKPIIVCLTYPNDIWDNIRDELEENLIPTFPMPELTVKAAWGLVEYGRILRNKYNK